LLATLLLFLSVPSAVGADGDARAKALFRKAELHFNIGEFDRALSLYREVYKLEPHPALIYNVAQCYRYLGRWREAIIQYQRYLDQTEEQTHRETVKKLIAECRVEAERAEAARAERARAEATRLNASAVPADEAPAPQPRGSSVLLWTGVGLSAAVLTVGVITGIVAYDRNQEYKDPTTPVDRRQELKDSGQPLAVGSVISLVLGGVLAAGTALYYWLAFHRGGGDRLMTHARPGEAVGVGLSW
jgi:tetratricopeptide (TPR) repeat protein